MHYLHDAELKAMDVWTYGRIIAKVVSQVAQDAHHGWVISSFLIGS